MNSTIVPDSRPAVNAQIAALDEEIARLRALAESHRRKLADAKAEWQKRPTAPDPTDHQLGWQLYAAFSPARDCRNEAQLAGWWAGLEADADTETAGWLAAANQECIEDEYEDIRRGM